MRRAAEEGLPAACAGEVRFVLQVEISNIYKRCGRTRKNHNLVFLPSLGAVEIFNAKLGAIGNLGSDGRPILGLDARHLLEIALETDPLAFLVPAHIWTPWFSLLGSKSGFDSLEECFGDLAGHVFAAETGLSSDPPMNWRVRSLDRLTLISNSDAHSPGKLGREANLLDIDLGYEPLLEALRDRRGFLGTIEFFPEEGKYHLDGHRKCGQRLEPKATRELGGRCPICGGPITVGVMSRVDELADRAAREKPPSAAPFRSLVPLDEIAGEALGCGASSGRAASLVERVLSEVGPELVALETAPLEELSRIGGPALAEAVRRVRCGELAIDAGYDGEFGTVRIFGDGERADILGQLSMAGGEAPARPARKRAREAAVQSEKPAPKPAVEKAAARIAFDPEDPLAGLDPSQRRVAESLSGPLLVVAGPGTGKTRTLVARIAHQVAAGIVKPGEVLAIAFTNQAADELRERLAAALPASAGFGKPFVATFHALCLHLLDSCGGGAPAIETQEDLDALLDKGLALLGDDVMRDRVAARFRSVSVDEYQDVSDVQAEIVAALSPGGRALCAIGDPDQAIYGFRGARPGHFARFEERYPGAVRSSLDTSYRLTACVRDVARAVLPTAPYLSVREEGAKVELLACPSPAAEAQRIAARIESLVGGTSHRNVGRGKGGAFGEIGFGEIAVLSRTKAQRREILAALGERGIPCLAVGEDEPHDPRSQKVAAMTMHASKGREFEVVFVAGAERGLLPLELEGFEVDPEEERRLLYVAITRARRGAILSWSQKRTLFGQRLPGGPSPFLSSAPDTAVTRATDDPPRRSSARNQLDLF